MRASFSDFGRVMKEHYIKPMNESYRNMYRKRFGEEPPEDMKLVMDRLIGYGEEQTRQLLEIIGKE